MRINIKTMRNTGNKHGAIKWGRSPAADQEAIIPAHVAPSLATAGERLKRGQTGIAVPVAVGRGILRRARQQFLTLALGLLGLTLWASDGGNLLGTVTDPTGKAVPGAKVTATETATAVKQTITTDGRGFYSFPSLPVGRYDVQVEASGFKPLRRTGIVVNVDSKVVVDASLAIGERTETITVSESAAHVETVDTQMGQVVTGQQMTSVPLNGRSYTDLLSLQAGVAPITTITSDTVQDVGATALSPSGDLNPGTISINGQREFANSFVLNGSDVEEDVNMGAAIIPN